MATPSTSMTGDGEASIKKTIEVHPILSEEPVNEEQLRHIFEIERCETWIKEHGFDKVCLQFPDEYLYYSPRILALLEKTTGVSRCYILADSTYGSCCVDEKTALHVPNAKALIHFGQSCLSPTSNRFQVLYIFTKPFVDVDKMLKVFLSNFNPLEDKVVIVFDVIYECAAEALYEELRKCGDDWGSVVMTELVVPGSDGSVKKSSENGFIKHGRHFPLEEKDVGKCVVFYVGTRALPNLLLTLPNCSFKVYDPLVSTDSLSSHTFNINKLLRKRNFYVEKVKDANLVGILVGTLVVQNYLTIIDRLKTILKSIGKRYVTVSIGEITTAKLANFMDIDCFVFVGCPEVVNYYISDDAKGQFYQPIVTPYDVELAFCNSDPTAEAQDYILDWEFLVEKGPPQVKPGEEDMSLISGELRSCNISQDKVIWTGLDINAESLSTDGTTVHKGLSGIASGYMEEPKL